MFLRVTTSFASGAPRFARCTRGLTRNRRGRSRKTTSYNVRFRAIPRLIRIVPRGSEQSEEHPIDLHALSTPPAFTLSQDQTLNKSDSACSCENAEPTLRLAGALWAESIRRFCAVMQYNFYTGCKRELPFELKSFNFYAFARMHIGAAKPRFFANGRNGTREKTGYLLPFRL